VQSRIVARLVWFICLLTVALVGLTLLLDLLNPPTGGSLPGQLRKLLYFTLAVPVAVVGALVTARRPHNRIGALLLAGGLAVAGDQFAWDYVDYGRTHGLPGVQVVGWVANWIWVLPFAVLLFGLLMYPDGRLPSRRWRLAAWLVASWTGLTIALGMLGGGIYDGPPLERQVGLQGAMGATVQRLMPELFSLLPILLLVSAGSLIARYRHAGGDERQQLKWLTYAAALTAVVWALPDLGQVEEWRLAAEILVLWSIPVAIGIAVLRYRLYAIDLVINRTLVYGVLTVCVAGIYVLAVAVLGALFNQRAELGVSLVATAVVAMLFAPLRGRLQRGVDRLLYGQRHEPYAVIARLGQQLEASQAPDAVLPVIVETVAQALKLPYVAIELRGEDGFEPAYTRGRLAGEPLQLALTHQGEALGRLVLGPRSPGEAFSPADRRLLGDLARQAGAAAHAVRLTADLQRSRERLVAAREEERRRLRRDLHDGLGPALAGMALQLDNLAGQLRGDPDLAVRATRLRDQMQGTVAEVRGIVEGLRPAALDELGIVGALHRHAAVYPATAAGGQATTPGPQVLLEAPDSLPTLPAAIEVAAYRIAAEALTNAVRHAGPTQCVVRLAAEQSWLVVEVADNGRGMDPGVAAGVGLESMRERAAEVGGSLEISSSDRGTVVRARLPQGIR
jgi:signal transduction histidine kinase